MRRAPWPLAAPSMTEQVGVLCDRLGRFGGLWQPSRPRRHQNITAGCVSHESRVIPLSEPQAARCLRGHPAPSAQHRGGLLEAGVRLQLLLRGDAERDGHGPGRRAPATAPELRCVQAATPERWRESARVRVVLPLPNRAAAGGHWLAASTKPAPVLLPAEAGGLLPGPRHPPTPHPLPSSNDSPCLWALSSPPPQSGARFCSFIPQALISILLQIPLSTLSPEAQRASPALSISSPAEEPDAWPHPASQPPPPLEMQPTLTEPGA